MSEVISIGGRRPVNKALAQAWEHHFRATDARPFLKTYRDRFLAAPSSYAHTDFNVLTAICFVANIKDEEDQPIVKANSASAMMTMVMLAQAPTMCPEFLAHDEYIRPEQMANFMKHAKSVFADTDMCCNFIRFIIAAQTNMPQMMRLATASFVLSLDQEERTMMEARMNDADVVQSIDWDNPLPFRPA